MNFRKISSVLSFALIIAGTQVARASCSNASVKGSYGIISTGLNGSSQPAASVDQVTVDGAGHISGTSTKSIDGSIVDYTLTGSYSIAANCTGTATFTNQDGQTEHDKIYLNNASATGLNTGAFLIQSDAQHVQSSIAVAQGAATCNDLGVKNSYSFESTGTVMGTGQVAAAGRLTLSGTGSISGTETLSLDGTIHASVSVTGSYTINSNCTGSATITPTGLSAVHLNLVVVNGGKELLAVETDPNTIVTATFQE